MKRLVLLICCLMLIGFPVVAAEKEPEPADLMDNINYSYGFQSGLEMLATAAELRAEALFQGIYDALGKAAPTKFDDEVDAVNYEYGFALGEVMFNRQIELRADAISDGLYDALAQKPPRLNEELMAQLLEPEIPTEEPPKVFRLPGQKYISENSSREGVITLASGLQYKILNVGKGNVTPKVTDTVLVNYRAMTIDGKEFSSTFPRGVPTPQEIPVNQGIAGWQEALQLMHEGDRWELTIPTTLAYRDSGPMAGQTVVFDVELLEIFPRGK